MPKITNLLLMTVLAAANILQPAAAMPEPLDIPPPQKEKEPKDALPQQWRLPLEGGRVSSFFGAARGRRAHGGIDFSVPHNTPVFEIGASTRLVPPHVPLTHCWPYGHACSLSHLKCVPVYSGAS